MRNERKRIFSGTYTHIVVLQRDGVSKNGFPSKWHLIKINGEEIPKRITNITFTQGCVTVFDFCGTLFVGGDHKAELTIYEYPNGVVQAEIKVI
jgi:hypothetical protein